MLVLAERTADAEPLAAHLVRRGFEVEVRCVGKDEGWLSQVLAAPPGAVLLDPALAAEQGWEVFKALKESPATRNVPVTFYGLEQGGGAVLEVDYLSKPMGAAELAHALQRQGMAGQRQTILVVDDEPAVREMHARVVEAQLPRCRVLQASDGRQALQIIRREPPDLVLLDLMMPEVDGFGVLEAMRREEATRSVPVIVLTAQVLGEEEMHCLNQGVAAVLGKGLFSVEETLAHVEAALTREPRLGSEMQRVVRQAMAYVHAHYAGPITREEVAHHVGVSKRHLSRCFRQETGLSLMTYLVRYRVERAKELLAAGLSVTEVAAAVGFSDGAHFSRVFRREAGVVPSKYQDPL